MLLKRSGIVFAGGRATRLAGVNKALLDVGGQTILERILAALRPRVGEMLAVVNDDSLASFPDLVLVPDPDPHAGVLPALKAGLQRAGGEVCLVTASDMPFVSGALFDALLELSDGYDLVIPRIDGQSEPMHAVYRRAACEAAVAAALARGERRMIAFHPSIRVRHVDEAELRRYDPQLLAFFNVNTPDDLAHARSLASQHP